MNIEITKQEFYRDYAHKLTSPLWQKKRLEVLLRDKWTCLSCNRNEIRLHHAADSLQVHHLKYFRNIEPWEYEMCYLVTFCKTCHETEHLIGDQIRLIHLEVLKANPLFIKPIAQATNLITEFPPFLNHLKNFLNEMTIHYLRSKEMENSTQLAPMIR